MTRTRLSWEKGLMAGGFAALSIALVVHAIYLYQTLYVVPRTPLHWGTLASDQLQSVLNTATPVLISFQEPKFSKVDLTHILEYGNLGEPDVDLRKLVYHHNLKLICVCYDGSAPDSEKGTEELLVEDLMEFMRDQCPRQVAYGIADPPWVLVLPKSKRIICFQNHHLKTETIREAIASDDEAFFTQSESSWTLSIVPRGGR